VPYKEKHPVVGLSRIRSVMSSRISSYYLYTQRSPISHGELTDIAWVGTVDESELGRIGDGVVLRGAECVGRGARDPWPGETAAGCAPCLWVWTGVLLLIPEELTLSL